MLQKTGKMSMVIVWLVYAYEFGTAERETGVNSAKEVELYYRRAVLA